MDYSDQSVLNLSPTEAVTHPRLNIRDSHDAHVVFEAVRLGILPLIKRRLVATERERLQSGNVFVWEEENDEGLSRWTDGRRWSQSRMRGDYLYYEEKVQTTPEERQRKATRRALRAIDPSVVLPVTKRKDRPSKPNGLTKKTYSAIVRPILGSRETRKWHIVAYCSGNDYREFPVVEDFDYLRRLTIPNDIFIGTKVSGPDRSSPSSDETSSYGFSSTPASPLVGHSSHPFGPIPTSSSVKRGGPRYSQEPVDTNRPKYNLPQLPPLSTSFSPRPHFSRQNSAPGSPQYTPLSPEDRRALDSLRVVL